MSSVYVKGARQIVLVVEDDVWQRSLAVDVLERAGYDVVEATNADEAIAIVETRKDIQIVFTDIEMPGSIDGLELARTIRDRWPPIELIIARESIISMTIKFHPEESFCTSRMSQIPLRQSLSPLAAS